MSNFEQQADKIRKQPGFIAALDQSGGSTPKALKLYGVAESTYSGETQMMDLIHAMRSRIITSPSFTGERVAGAILFEATMDRDIDGTPTAEFLWTKKQVVPFLKIDKGLEDEKNGVQLMKAMPTLDQLLAKAKAQGHLRHEGAFGHQAGERRGHQGRRRAAVRGGEAGSGSRARTDHRAGSGHPLPGQGEGREAAEGRAPRRARPGAVEPAGHAEADAAGVDDFYKDLVAHPRVLKVVALSGGYPRIEANTRLAKQKGMIASFSRALTEGLTAQQSDAEFNAALDTAIEGIYQASKT